MRLPGSHHCPIAQGPTEPQQELYHLKKEQALVWKTRRTKALPLVLLAWERPWDAGGPRVRLLLRLQHRQPQSQGSLIPRRTNDEGA